MDFRPLRRLGPLLPALLSCLSANAADVFVGPSGSDSHPGTRSQPFATLERAREEVRQLRTRDALGKAGATVWILPGDYFVTNSVRLETIDSGASNSPVTWRAYGRDPVRLTGGIAITNWTRVTDPALLNRLPMGTRETLRVAELSHIPTAVFGQMKSRGFSRPAAPSHGELFCGGKPMTLARWPNAGQWAQIDGFPEESARPDDHGGKYGAVENGFRYAGDRPRQWQPSENIWVHGYWAWDWANSYERVASLDTATRHVRTAPPHGLYGFRKGQRYYFLNVFEELDEPGEWFLDVEARRLYFWPPESLDQPRRAPEVWLSLSTAPFFELENVSHVTVQGLTLEATRGNAVEIRGGNDNCVKECTLRNIGNYAVIIRGGTGHGVAGSQVLDTGDGGVQLEGGDRQTLAPGGHYVEDCEFARQGRWSKCYVPAVLMNGVGLRVSHNLVRDHPHCAILYGGNDHQIEFNEIHHIALETGDVGAIYAGRDYTFRGNRIRYNYIHHTGGVGMGSMGVYMDDCVSGAEIYGNVFYKVQRAAFLGGGRDHRVINNIFVDCNHAVELDGRGLDPSPVWRNMVDKTMRQSLGQVPAELYRGRYPEMKSLDAWYGPPGGPAILGEAFKGVPPEHNVVARNVCVGKWLNVYWHATKGMIELRDNLAEGDPGFARKLPETPRATDFKLKGSSPAWKLGFEPIPLEQIGPRRR